MPAKGPQDVSELRQAEAGLSRRFLTRDMTVHLGVGGGGREGGGGHMMHMALQTIKLTTLVWQHQRVRNKANEVRG